MIRQGAPTRGRRPPTEWELRLEAEKRERELNLRELMAELAEARDTRAEWYVWILEGRPVLTEEEYARVGRHAGARNRRPSSPRGGDDREPDAGARETQGQLM